MHSMIGCHVVGCNNHLGFTGKGAQDINVQNYNPFAPQQPNNTTAIAGTDIIDDTVYYMLTIKLSEKFKRIFYFLDCSERDLWYLRLKKATGEKPEVTDKFILNKIIGEGSFGKVYNAQSISSKEKVAIKLVDKEGLRKEELE